MRRSLSLVLLMLTACSEEPAAPPPPDSTRALYAGEGRDRFCRKGERAGFITYGPGDSNCSAKGRIEGAGEGAALVPDGDEDCRIALTIAGERLSLGPVTAACGYYCGPGAGFGGKAFTAAPDASPAVDFAGDPLC